MESDQGNPARRLARRVAACALGLAFFAASCGSPVPPSPAKIAPSEKAGSPPTRPPAAVVPPPSTHGDDFADIFWGEVGDNYRRVIRVSGGEIYEKKFPPRRRRRDRRLRFYTHPADPPLVAAILVGNQKIFERVIPVNTADWVQQNIGLRDVDTEIRLTIRLEKSVGEAFITPPREIRHVTQRRPPIILISLDTLRADHLPIHGYSRNTAPFLAEFAKQAFVFDDVVAPSPWTLPSHISMMSGLDAFTHQVFQEGRSLPSNVPTLSLILGDTGYATAAITGITYVSHHYLHNFQSHYEYTEEDPKGDLAVNTPKLLAYVRNHKDEPFYLFFHTYTIHAPYTGDDFMKGIRQGTHEETVARYDAGIHRADQVLGLLFSELRQQNLFDSALIIVTSDHGEELADRGGKHPYYGHGHSFYQEVIRVPLLIKFPAQECCDTPIRVRDPVGLVDILSTVLDFLNIHPPPVLDGHSLLPMCLSAAENSNVPDSFIAQRTAGAEGPMETREYLIGGANKGPLGGNPGAIRRGRFKLISRHKEPKILYDKNQVELYDLERDPPERFNLLRAGSEEADRPAMDLFGAFYKTRNARMARYTPAYVMQEKISEVEKRKLRALGYLQ